MPGEVTSPRNRCHGVAALIACCMGGMAAAEEAFLEAKVDGKAWKGSAKYEQKEEGKLTLHLISAAGSDGSAIRIQILTEDRPLQRRSYPEDQENTKDRVTFHYLPESGNAEEGFAAQVPKTGSVEITGADEKGIRGTFRVELKDNESGERTVKLSDGRFTIALGEGPPAKAAEEE